MYCIHCTKNAQFRDVLAGGAHNSHCVLKCYSIAIICFILNLHVRLLQLHTKF